MRLYLATCPGVTQVWLGTQAEARSAAVVSGLGWQQVEVPTDKPGLIDFLNTGLRELLSPPIAPASPAPPSPAKCETTDWQRRRDELRDQSGRLAFAEEAIAEANGHQLGALFAACASRLEELRRGHA
jgi:hypothetical protein